MNTALRRILAVLAVAVTVLAPSAWAAGPGPWYIGAAFGKSQVEDFSSNSVRHDFILGWRPLPNLALEGSYINLGRFDDATAPDPLLLINGFGGAAVGFLPLGQHVELLGRYGLHKLDIEHNYEGYEPALARILGLGVEWSLPERLAVRVEFQAIYGISDRHSLGKYQAVSLIAGLFYRF